MPHERIRQILPSLLKRLKLWPVVGVLGPRQIGKTTLLRAQLADRIGAQYITLDQKENRTPAFQAPDHFIRSRLPGATDRLILDEVQKVPDLFDAVKAEVDERRYPGRILLSGSTEFSKKTGIRESLTGRIGLTRLYPMTLSELYERDFVAPWVQFKVQAPVSSEAEVRAWLEHGGMPGICFLRDERERALSFEGWVDTTCYRDLQQIRSKTLSGDLAKEVLTFLARSERPTATEAAAQLKVDIRKIKTHIEALEALFVLHRVESHPLGIGSGKPKYYLFDSGLAHHLGANPMTCLKVWFLNECFAQHEYSGNFHPRIRYYESTKHSEIDFIIESKTLESEKTLAILITDEAAPSTYTLRALESFKKKIFQEGEVRSDFLCAILAPTQNKSFTENNDPIVPWTAMG